MPNYEIMFIVNPSVAEEEIDKINTQFEGMITASGGKIGKIEKMGKRRLAYPVDKFTDGFYVLFVMTANGAIVREMERRLRVMDPVIKYLTVRMDEDMKRLDKIKAHRQRRAARRGSGGSAGAGVERGGEKGGPMFNAGAVAVEEEEE
jgi:small subunit ribosomal protein S6